MNVWPLAVRGLELCVDKSFTRRSKQRQADDKPWKCLKQIWIEWSENKTEFYTKVNMPTTKGSGAIELAQCLSE